MILGALGGTFVGLLEENGADKPHDGGLVGKDADDFGVHADRDGDGDDMDYRLIYDSLAGCVLLDPDGSGPASALVLAILSGMPPLTLAQLEVIA